MVLEEHTFYPIEIEMENVTENNIINNRRAFAKTQFFQKLRKGETTDQELSYFFNTYTLGNKEVASFILGFIKERTLAKAIQIGLLDLFLSPDRKEEAYSEWFVVKYLQSIEVENHEFDLNLLLNYIDATVAGSRDRTASLTLVSLYIRLHYFKNAQDDLTYKGEFLIPEINEDETFYTKPGLEALRNNIDKIAHIFIEKQYEDDSMKNTFNDFTKEISIDIEPVRTHFGYTPSEVYNNGEIAEIRDTLFRTGYMPILTADFAERFMAKHNFHEHIQFKFYLVMLNYNRLDPEEGLQTFFNKIVEVGYKLKEPVRKFILEEIMDYHASALRTVGRKLISKRVVTNSKKGTKLYLDFVQNPLDYEEGEVPDEELESHKATEKLKFLSMLNVNDKVSSEVVEKYLSRRYNEPRSLESVYFCHPDYPQSYPKPCTYRKIAEAFLERNTGDSFSRVSDDEIEAVMMRHMVQHYNGLAIITWKMANSLDTIDYFWEATSNLSEIINLMNVKNLGADKVIARFEKIIAITRRQNGELPFYASLHSCGARKTDYGELGTSFWKKAPAELTEFYINHLSPYISNHLGRYSIPTIERYINYHKLDSGNPYLVQRLLLEEFELLGEKNTEKDRAEIIIKLSMLDIGSVPKLSLGEERTLDFKVFGLEGLTVEQFNKIERQIRG